VIPRRPLLAVLLVAALVAVAPSARAASVELKVRTILRDKPSASARIVDRLPAGKKMPMMGTTANGNWVHVRVGGKEGWVQASAIKGLRANNGDDGRADQEAEEDDPGRPLAKKRGVRPEAWVSKSRYHDGEDTKLIISVNKAELFGRPANTGAVLGVLRRGEQVQLVRKSADKKWVNVDIGGGETAWIEARAVKPGKVTSTPSPEESSAAQAAAPPAITPEGATTKAKLAKVEKQPEPEAAAEPEAPKKKGRQAPQEAPPPRKPREIEDETPPGLARSKRKSTADEPRIAENRASEENQQREQASRSDEPTSAPAQTGVVKDYWNARGKVYISPGVRAGVAILSQRFTSNGTGALTNYEANTNALGAQVGLGLFGALGRYFLLGGDASYSFAGAAALRVPQADGSTLKLGIQAHTADAGLSAGVHFGVAGGLTLRLRVGGQMVLNLMQPDVRAKLPSDRILGMTVGLGLAVPALFSIGERPFGVWLGGSVLAPADRAQTTNLEDGTQSSTFGGFFGGGLSFALMPVNQGRYRGQLALEAAYSYEVVATHYTGQSKRNTTITVADRGSAQQLITAGLGFYY